MASTYVAVRDDRSLSLNERSFLRSCALKQESSRVLRVDGRGPGEVRRIRILLSRSENGAECTILWGETRVSAEITGSLQPPFPDRPSEGMVSLLVDASPMASTSFGLTQPVTNTPGLDSRSIPTIATNEAQKLLSNRILRCLERTILIGGALDTEALCVHAGLWVWRLTLTVRLLDHGGNLMDASVLSALAALRHYRKPHVDMVDQNLPQLVHPDLREPTPLPIHHTPLTMSFALIHADDVALSTSSTATVAALVDPTDREEMVQTGSIALAMNVHSEVCLLDFGGGCELRPSQLKQCWQLAEKSILGLCEMLEKSLKEADDKAQRERLHRLQQTNNNNNSLPPLSKDSEPNVPFWQESDSMQVDTSSGYQDVMNEVERAVAAVQDQQEEAYRLRALEYGHSHVAAKVKDDGGKTETNNKEPTGTLLAAMLKSAHVDDDDQRPRESDQNDNSDNNDESRLAGNEKPTLSQEANDEFKALAEKLSAKAKKSNTTPKTKSKATAKPIDVDDEEEETTTILHNEFQSIPAKSPQPVPKKKSEPKKKADDGDVDDLAMAIKPKKKKKSKKSK